jgi:arylformamidase
MAAMTVYRDLEQDALDAQLNPRAASPSFFHHLRRWGERSAPVRAGAGAALDLAYGEDPAERLDLYRAGSEVAPLLLFFHGGEWQSLDKAGFAFLAPPFLARGVAVALVNYGRAPDCPLALMVERGRRAVVWLNRNAPERDLDPARFYIAGHGAGAHLALAAVSASWRPYELLGNPVTGAAGLGGIYDLEPVRLSYLNAALGLDRETAERLSPVHRPPPRGCAVWLATGGRESLEIRRQARALASSWRGEGCVVETAEFPGEDHFSLLDRLAAPGSLFQREVLLRLAAA